MVSERTVTALSGKVLPIVAETICVHGDGKDPIAFSKKDSRSFIAKWLPHCSSLELKRSMWTYVSMILCGKKPVCSMKSYVSRRHSLHRSHRLYHIEL